MVNVQSYIDAAKDSKTGTVTITVPIEEVKPTVAEFEKVCPTVKHSVSMDWDDDTLYRVKFMWEPGKFVAKPVSIQTPLPQYRPEVARAPKPGGPRW
jgi:hypothetical protein